MNRQQSYSRGPCFHIGWISLEYTITLYYHNQASHVVLKVRLLLLTCWVPAVTHSLGSGGLCKPTVATIRGRVGPHSSIKLWMLSPLCHIIVTTISMVLGHAHAGIIISERD